MALIEKPAEIIKHIITEEVGASVNTSSYSAIDSLENKLAFTVHDKQVNSKKLIEEIASNTRVIPYFKNNELKMQRIKPDVQAELEEDGGDVKLYINQSDVISYTNKRTAPEKVYTEVVVNYHYDYALKEFTKNTKEDSDIHDTAVQYFENDPHGASEVYDIANIGLDKEQEYTFDAHYIRDIDSAEALQNFLLLWNCNQHNSLKMKLPLKYIQLNVGDYVGFDKLINGVKLFGEDYSIEHYYVNNVFRNGQQIMPVWMITAVNKTVTHIDIELIQMHNCIDQPISSANLPPYIERYNLNLIHPTNQSQVLGTDIVLSSHDDTYFKVKLSVEASDPNLDNLIYKFYINENIDLDNIPDLDGDNLLADIDGNSNIGEYQSENIIEIELGIPPDDSTTNGQWLTDWLADSSIPDGANIEIPANLLLTSVRDDATPPLSTQKRFPPFKIWKNTLPNYIPLDINYNEDWNLIGFPLIRYNPFYNSIYPNAIAGTAFLYTGTGYEQVNELVPGRGYWIRFNQSGTQRVYGEIPDSPFVIQLTDDWNIVSIPGVVGIEASVFFNAGVMPATIFGYNGGFYAVNSNDLLEPGAAYWMRTDGGATVLLDIDSEVDNE